MSLSAAAQIRQQGSKGSVIWQCGRAGPHPEWDTSVKPQECMVRSSFRAPPSYPARAIACGCSSSSTTAGGGVASRAINPCARHNIPLNTFALVKHGTWCLFSTPALALLSTHSHRRTLMIWLNITAARQSSVSSCAMPLAHSVSCLLSSITSQHNQLVVGLHSVQGLFIPAHLQQQLSRKNSKEEGGRNAPPGPP